MSRGARLRMKNEIRWLAFLSVLAYAIVQFVPSTVFSGAMTLMASAVWGN
jgi:hypothetical protein